jgi:hypothetical protein
VTIHDLEVMEAAMLRRLMPWGFKAGKLIRESIADARAHAQLSITASLKEETDGRPTQRRLERNRSYAAAVARIDELGKDLDAIIRDARAAFYLDSIKLWLPHIPDANRIEDAAEPKASIEAICRDAVIGGYSLAMELGPAIATAKRTLTVACSVAGRESQSDRRSDQRIALWSTQTTTSLLRKSESILSDSDTAIHEATGWLLIAPKFRGQRLVDPEAGMHF